MKSYDITPVPKPRMTLGDKWKKRPIVLRYWAFCEEVRINNIQVNTGDHVTFQIKMPKSWSKKKKESMDMQPHEQTPDVDNLTKALLDAIYKNDSHISDLRITKIWSRNDRITICSMNFGHMES